VSRDPTGRAVLVSGQPLLFVHFSQWSVETPDGWMKRRESHPGSLPGIVSEICVRYRDALVRNSYLSTKESLYGFGYFSDGRPISREMRQHFFVHMRGEAPSEKSPFDMPAYFYFTCGPTLTEKARVLAKRAEVRLGGAEQRLRAVLMRSR
jgi:hypothetical protein